ncbi:MAG: sugar phosphate nucleotidyltransferase [Nitrospirota bacterium]|nr:sugar phosphate nucleotidyltransferase [Nitrospirota bacterium]
MRTGSHCDVVILCGGLGARLRSVVNDRPKPMAMVHERPFLEFVVNHLIGSGFSRLIFCTGYKGEWIKHHFQDARQFDALFSEESEPLGTAGALRQCRSLLGTSTFLVVNGDSFCALDLTALLKAHYHADVLATVAVVAGDGRSDGGSVMVDVHGRISSFHEKGTSGSYLNAGIYACAARFLDHIPDRLSCSLEYDVFPSLLAKGICGFVTSEPLYDIGTPERLTAFRAFSASRLMQAPEERARC